MAPTQAEVSKKEYDLNPMSLDQLGCLPVSYFHVSYYPKFHFAGNTLRFLMKQSAPILTGKQPQQWQV